MTRCTNPAVWWMQGRDPYDFTVACNDHVEFMKWDGHFDTYPYDDNDSNFPCCFIYHVSDCAVHNEPAMPNGPCNCGDDASS